MRAVVEETFTKGADGALSLKKLDIDRLPVCMDMMNMTQRQENKKKLLSIF